MTNRTSAIHSITLHPKSRPTTWPNSTDSPSYEPSALTCQFYSQAAQSKPQKPRPLTCAGTQVGTGRDRRVRTPSADCSEMGSRQRRRQPHYLSPTISPVAAMQRPGASTPYRPSPLTGYAKTKAYLRAEMEYLQELQ